MDNNIFQTIKQTISKHDFKDFVQSVYGIEFKSGNAFCPFHDHGHNTPSLGINSDSNGAFFKCFACNASGDITKFVELKEHISPLQAAKKVCDHFGIPNTINAKEMSEEEKKAYEEHQALIKAENEARIKKEAEQRAKKEVALKARLAKIAPQLVENKLKNYDLIKDQISALFPTQVNNFDSYSRELIGYSFEHKSLAIIIRDASGAPVNIKYREKFAYDTYKGELTSERMPGKWIGESGAHANPFPLNFYDDYKGSNVVICEGEKDALNLMCFNVCALTLGGVTASWEEYKELLRDKHVFIWFDHDEAGYENAIKKFYEIKDVARSVRIVLFYMIGKNFSKGYDISDYLYDHAYKFQNASPLEVVAFSCFEPTNVVIDEICEYFPNLSAKLDKFKQNLPIKEFRQIKAEILARDEEGNFINIFPVKGELDDKYVEEVLNSAKELERKMGERYEEFKKAYIQSFLLTEQEEQNFERFSKAFSDAFRINKTMRTNYHQTHITDMVASLNQTFLKLGYRLGEYKKNLHVWASNHFMQIDTNALAKFIHSHWMAAAYVDKKKQSRENVNKIVEDLTSLSLDLDEIKSHESRRVINLLNGTIFISKNGVITFKKKHDYKDAATNILKFNYDPSAKSPKWNKFLRDIMSDEDDIKTLMEFIGYCFIPSHEFESFLFLYGKSGANGKSVILDTIRNFFGEDNVSSLQLQQFEGHQLCALTNKLLNIGSEIDKNGTDKGQLANLKAIVSTKDAITINPKNEEPYSLLPNEKPKLAFAGNEKPKSGIDNGVFRRMLLIVFDKEVKDNQKIRGLSDRFNDELGGIFNLALEGLKRLIIQNKFTRSKRMQTELEEYKDSVNPLRTFVKDVIIADADYFVPSVPLYKVYLAYMNDKGGKPIAQKNFVQALRDELTLAGISCSYGQKRMSANYIGVGDRPRCFFGFRVSSNNLDFDSVRIENGGELIINQINHYQANGAKADEN
ncbi:phage/plasmid primase, P4 family [Campylobacter concisus]|uniref:phage/plasmid primase, P4 family n=1 Tax=Campylobacter concisus TaxID=199 RepID=UPI000D30FB51|nr:phage/plasmid primase, P4 family [Campylobacter concisus]